MSEAESGGSTHGSPPTEGEIPLGKLLPLNSRRLTTYQLKKIAEGLGLPTTGSADETRQLIEGKLEEGHDVHNVQVVVQEATTVNVTLSLMDEEGVFLNVDQFQRAVKDSSESEEMLEKLANAEQKGVELRMELDQTRDLLAKEQEKSSKLAEELSSAKTATTAPGEIAELQSKLKAAQEKVKQVWRLNCAQSQEQEELLATKDDRITTLEAEIKRLKAAPRASPRSGSGASSPDGSRSGPILANNP